MLMMMVTMMMMAMVMMMVLPGHTVLAVVRQLLVGVDCHQDGPRVRVDLVLLVPLLQVLVDPVPGDDDDEDDGVNGGEDEEEGDGDGNATYD